MALRLWIDAQHQARRYVGDLCSWASWLGAGVIGGPFGGYSEDPAEVHVAQASAPTQRQES